jgi:hypothetical protein
MYPNFGIAYCAPSICSKLLSSFEFFYKIIMTIIHIVFFEWKPSTSHAQVEEVGGPTTMTMSMLTLLS